MSDELAKRLHDRATRGEALSAEERDQLERWYEAQDRAEMEALSSVAETESLSALQAQVDSVMVQLGTVTQRIRAIADENDVLRGEIAAFRRQLAQQMIHQPA